MDSDVSFSLGPYFEQFIQREIRSGKYTSAGEVIRAGLRLLEKEEEKMEILRNSLKEGEESSMVSDFNQNEFLQKLKTKLS
jgi:antitoxin ParD1/3/4